MSETDIELGQKVQDEISGFTGIVTLIGDHISGCERIGVHPVGEKQTVQRGDQEFFYEEQLRILQRENEWTEELDPRTDSEVSLGNIVSDQLTGITGTAVVINYKLFNCPSVCVQPSGDSNSENPDKEWIDDVRLQVKAGGVHGPYAADDASTEETGSVEDRRPRNLSR